MFWVLQNAVVWDDVWELALSWWRVIRLRRLAFLIPWKTTGKQMVVYHSEFTVLLCSCSTIATCPVFAKTQAIICLEVLRARATFVGFGSSWNTARVNPRFINCHDVKDVFRSTAIVFLEHFFRPIGTRIFWAVDKLCGIQREQIFLTVKCLCTIECILVPLIPKVVSISW